MRKMRMFSRYTLWFAALRGAALAAVTAYVVQPLSANAVSLKICSAAGDACDKFVNKYISPIVLLLSACIGIFAVISIIIAGIQYSTSGDDPGAVNKAKNRIFQTIIGLVAYLFLFAFLNYVVPGGLI